MPRQPRADEAGGICHALNRGNARNRIFYKDGDFEAFERIIADWSGGGPGEQPHLVREQYQRFLIGSDVQVVANPEFAVNGKGDPGKGDPSRRPIREIP